MEFQRPPHDFRLGDLTCRLGQETKIMGVLNVTPDSFSDGGFFCDPRRAVLQALKMEREGAHILDVGGESSRPGSKPISAREEIRRLRPVLRRLSREIKIPISVDTYKYEVAHAALDEGALLINDIYGLRGNKRLAKLITKYKASVALMHMRGTPVSMQKRPVYRNLLKDIRDYLRRAVDLALDAGIPRSAILIDPGFGFGKTAEQNLVLLDQLDFFLGLKLPILVGLSRKSFIGGILSAPAGDRLYGSLAAAAIAIQRGAHVLRVHDVAPHRSLTLVMDKTLWN